MLDKSIIEVSLEIEKEFVEPVSYLLKKYCDFDYIVEEKLEYSPDENETKPEINTVIIRSYIIDDKEQKSKIAFIEGGISLIRLVAEIPEIRIKKILEKEWINQEFPSIKIGEKFIISSDKSLSINKDSRILINLNPGLGFGTGHHPTTKMMLEHIEKINFSNKKVLDFGCGSGILTIAVNKMDALEVWSIDTDEMAIISSQENLKRSNINTEKLLQGSLETLDNKLLFDIILANISSNIIMKYSYEMKKKLSLDGLLICSGILSKDADITSEKLIDNGFEMISKTIEEDWVSMILRWFHMRIFYKDKIEEIIEIVSSRTHKIKSVLRSKLGDEIEIFDGNGTSYISEIMSISNNSVKLKVDKNNPEIVINSSPQITLAFSILKPSRYEIAIEKTTEIGISNIVPLITQHTNDTYVKMFSQNRIERLENISISAAEQCGTNFVPSIQSPKKLPEFLNFYNQEDTLKILFYEKSKSNKLTSKKLKEYKQIILVIGPEGGFSEQELDIFKKYNYEIESLGNNILRGETAAICAVHNINMLISSIH